MMTIPSQYISPMYGISRIDQLHQHAWFVRLHCVQKKPKIVKSFSDGIYGGIVQSFSAAIAFRDANLIKKDVKQISYKDASLIKYTKKEKLKRRMDAIEKMKGQDIIYVGTGVLASLKARDLGFSQITCLKIRNGKRDSVKLYNFLPGLHLDWKHRKTGKITDINTQLTHGKHKFVLGIGPEAARKAQNLGASSSVCQKIFKGLQDSFNCCYTKPYFEVNGFIRELNPELVNKINQFAAYFATNNWQEIAAEVMLNYASRNEVCADDNFIKALVLKYLKISKVTDFSLPGRKRKSLTLDINGDIEIFNDSGGQYGKIVRPSEDAQNIYDYQQGGLCTLQ